MTNRQRRSRPPVRGSPVSAGTRSIFVSLPAWAHKLDTIVIALPKTLSAAVASAEALEARIARTRTALVAAQDRAERTASELAQAQAEYDQLAATRDLALAALEMGEQPETPLASTEKAISASTKDLTAARTDREAADGAARGLKLRLTGELAERAGIMQQIEAGQGDARLAIQEAAVAALDKVEQLLVRELGPLVQAEIAVNGDLVATWLRQIHLERENGKPDRTDQVRKAIAALVAPADFQAADTVCRRLRAAAVAEA